MSGPPDPFGIVYRTDDPLTSDPRFQRRVLAVRWPIPFVANIYEVKLACGHEPLMMGGSDPRVGDSCFCPSCYELAKEEKGDGA